jgi:hypothetical protein
MSGACHQPRGQGYGLLLGTHYIEYIENRPHPSRFEPPLGILVPIIQSCRLMQIMSHRGTNKTYMSGACYQPRRQGYGLLLGTPYIEYIENRSHPQQVRAPIRDTRPHNTIMPPSADCVP